MSTDTSSPNNNSPSSGDGNTTEEATGTYECNICLETANDAVVSMCGHLFWYDAICFHFVYLVYFDVHHLSPAEMYLKVCFTSIFCSDIS